MLNVIKGGLVVSCQALEHEPLHSSFIMAKMALAAKEGGAAGIRANSKRDIIAIKQEVALPVIGKIYGGAFTNKVRTDCANEVDIANLFLYTVCNLIFAIR